MQASKIIVGDVYAILRGDNLRAVKVEAVITHRTGSKTYNSIKAVPYDVVADQVVAGSATVEYDPQDITGPYAATQAELDAKEARKVQRKLEAKQAEDRAIAILNAFAAHFGVPKPKRVKEYGSFRYPNDLPFRLDYSDKIEVTHEGMEILAKFLRVDFVSATSIQQQQEDNQDGATVINMK